MAPHLGTLVLATLGALPAAPAPVVDPAGLRADLRFALDTIARQHPDPAHSVTKPALERAAARVRRRLDHPMTQAEAWSALARLNPVLADGHLFVGLPDWRGWGAAAIGQGTGFFPFEVALDAAGYPVVVAALGGAPTPFAGRRIRRIDGRDARAVARALLARAHGDTPAFRRALVAQRWWLFYAKLYGTPDRFALVLDRGDNRQMPAGHALPAILQRDADFDRLFACRIAADGSATLAAVSFAWPDKPRFFRFTQDCFARMKAASTRRLVVDVSANGGGDDDLWKDGILRYIATRPYRQGAGYVKRARDGTVTTGTIETPTVPAADEPLRFSGTVAVRIGPSTYSSAVLFANVVRDYGFGTLVGQGDAARTRQSGGVQAVTLPRTGLVLSYPRFVLDPPGGARVSRYLEPTARP